MTISQTGNALGGVISANGTPVANVTSAAAEIAALKAAK